MIVYCDYHSMHNNIDVVVVVVIVVLSILITAHHHPTFEEVPCPHPPTSLAMRCTILE